MGKAMKINRGEGNQRVIDIVFEYTAADRLLFADNTVLANALPPVKLFEGTRTSSKFPDQKIFGVKLQSVERGDAYAPVSSNVSGVIVRDGETARISLTVQEIDMDTAETFLRAIYPISISVGDNCVQYFCEDATFRSAFLRKYTISTYIMYRPVYGIVGI